ncbi:MAG: extracellular solute-binding protein [Candidatus Brocadiae bacterium]|nr:extracellular solute-binding protein [Candidatus Brocadiia bacterium]
MISSWLKGAEPLVVYCAHDAVYSKQILDRFTEETGIAVRFVPDTEATKSLGFVERLIREKDAPRCDVFWNNQLLGTLDLHEKGILQPCKGPGFDRIPDAYKDPDGHWVGFAARFRVYIVNTEKLEATEEAVKARLDAADLSRVAIAKPLYGTTLSHYGILWQRWGGDKLKAWHMGCRDRKIVEATGNAHVKDLVASGVCGLGLTDTDDFFGARDAGKPVEMLPVRLDDDSTICIPNTVCIIKGTRQPLRARQLVDYLLSESTELALAASKARQVPLGPVDDAQLAEEVRAMAPWVADGVPLAGLGPARAECLAWLKGLYVQ